MKKMLCIVAAAALLLALTACGTASKTKDTLTGTPAEVLARVREASRADLAMTIDSEVVAKNAQRVLGLTGAQFTEYVDCAYAALSALTTTAQCNAVVKCKDAAAAVQVKKLIANGYDCDQWTATVPEQCIAVESGSYVMLAVGTAEATEAFARALENISGGNIGEPDVFFQEY